MEGALRPSDGVTPHPPKPGMGEENNNASGPSPPSSLVNGNAEPIRIEENIHKQKEPETNLVNGKDFRIHDGRNRSGLNSLSDPLDVGARRSTSTSLFASPLDPVRPSGRGLGGLEPLALRRVPEPLDGADIVKSRLETKRMLWDGGGADTDDQQEKEHLKKEEHGVILNEDRKDTHTNVENVIRIRGAVESETSDAHDLDFLRDKSLSHEVRSGESSEPSLMRVQPTSEDTVRRSVVEGSTNFSSTVLDIDDGIDKGDNDSLDILPDNAGSRGQGVGVKLAVAAALKEEITQQDNNSDNTSHKSEEIIPLKSKIEEAVESHQTSMNKVRNLIQEEKAHATPMINVIDEDDSDDDDDDLIMASTPSHSSTVEMENLTNSLKLEEGTLKEMLSNHDEDGERSEKPEEENMSGDIVERSHDLIEKSESDQNEDEDEENLRRYMAVTLKEAEEDEESSRAVSSSSGSLPRAGRLSPITSANAPPPLPANFSSPAMRTAYKRDDMDDSFANSEISDATDTNRSLSSTAMLLHTLTNKGARTKNK